MRNCAVTAAAGTSDTTIDTPGCTLQGGAAAFTSCSILTIVRAGDILIDRKSSREYRNGASDGRFDPTNACLARGNRGSQSCMERPMNRLAGLFLAFAVSLAAIPSPAAAQDKSLTIFAAASMKNALDEIDAAYTAKSGVKITVSYAASSALGKADRTGRAGRRLHLRRYRLDGLRDSERRRINEPSRVNLLGNSIVLIAPKDSKVDNVNIGPGFDLAKLAGDGKIATGDVKSVPVGKYAKAALEKLGSWQAAEPKFAMAESVRAALTLVARGEAVLGIVYSTDAKVEPGVKVVGTFPADSHPAIIYPVAATTTAKPETTDYLAFLRSTAAKTILEKYGFKFLVSPST